MNTLEHNVLLLRPDFFTTSRLDTDVENKHMDTKGGKWRGGGGGGKMNWEIGIDMYTLMCIKLMTNKNLLYKKINKIKFKKKTECRFLIIEARKSI